MDEIQFCLFEDDRNRGKHCTQSCRFYNTCTRRKYKEEWEAYYDKKEGL